MAMSLKPDTPAIQRFYSEYYPFVSQTGIQCPLIAAGRLISILGGYANE